MLEFEPADRLVLREPFPHAGWDTAIPLVERRVQRALAHTTRGVGGAAGGPGPSACRRLGPLTLVGGGRAGVRLVVAVVVAVAVEALGLALFVAAKVPFVCR